MSKGSTTTTKSSGSAGSGGSGSAKSGGKSGSSVYVYTPENTFAQSNAIGKTMLVIETIKSIMFAIIFMGLGAAIEYWAINYAPSEDGVKLAGISIGALFFLIGLFVAIFQVFTWNSVMKGPAGAATRWYENHQAQKALALEHARANKMQKALALQHAQAMHPVHRGRGFRFSYHR